MATIKQITDTVTTDADIELARESVIKLQQEQVPHVVGVGDALVEVEPERVPHVVERAAVHMRELAAVGRVERVEAVDAQEVIDLRPAVKAESAPVDGRLAVQQQANLLDVLQAEARDAHVRQRRLEDEGTTVRV